MPTVRAGPSAPMRPSGATSSRRRRQRRRRWPFVIIPLMVLAALGLYGGLLARDVWRDVTVARAALTQGMALLGDGHVTSITPPRLYAAEADFRRAQDALIRAQMRLGRWGTLATSYGGLLPGSAKDVQSVVPLLDFGRQAAGAAVSLAEGLRPALVVLHDPAPSPSGASGGPRKGLLAQLTGALESAQPALAQAQRQLAAAHAARGRLRGLPTVASVSPMLATFDRWAPKLDSALLYAGRLPSLLGGRGPRSYLVLFQDPADLRATGGYIGSASLVTLDKGVLSQIDYEDSGTLIPTLEVPRGHSLPPLLPLLYYRNLGSLELRDANFWPDFPTSAAQISRIYKIITGRQVDGVIALQPTLISYLLGALGPLAVPTFDETVTESNVLDRIDYYTHRQPGAESNPHRKRFIVALDHALLDELLHPNSSRLPAVLAAVERGFANRSIVATLNDPVFGQALSQAHWDGALRGDGGDYLGVYDQNVTDSKLNPYIAEGISYVVQQRTDGGLDCRVTITYRNHQLHTSSWIPRAYYEDYVRIAVPDGSTVRDLTGFDEAFWPMARERGRMLIPGGMRVPAGGTRTVSFAYTVPPTALQGITGYRLLFQEQPGAPPPTLSVQVSAHEKVWTAQTVVTRDLNFSTSWDAPSGQLRMQIAP